MPPEASEASREAHTMLIELHRDFMNLVDIEKDLVSVRITISGQWLEIVSFMAMDKPKEFVCLENGRVGTSKEM